MVVALGDFIWIIVLMSGIFRRGSRFGIRVRRSGPRRAGVGKHAVAILPGIRLSASGKELPREGRVPIRKY